MYTPKFISINLLWNKSWQSYSKTPSLLAVSHQIFYFNVGLARETENVLDTFMYCVRELSRRRSLLANSEWVCNLLSSPRVCCEGRKGGRADGREQGTVICCMIIVAFLLRLILARIQCWSQEFIISRSCCSSSSSCQLIYQVRTFSRWISGKWLKCQQNWANIHESS